MLFCVIVEMVEPKFLTGVVIVVILVPIILMGYFIWKKNCDTTKEPSKLIAVFQIVSFRYY